MSKIKFLVFIAFSFILFYASGAVFAGEEGKNDTPKKLRVLVVAGGHGYDVKPFREVFHAYKDMDCTFIDEKTTGEAFEDISNFSYDAIVLYNYKRKITEKQQENFLKLMDRGVGLVVLHHAIYGYLPWKEYYKVVGSTAPLDGWKDDVEYKVHVEDPKHPITQGVTDFTITDETYHDYKVDPKVHVILTTDEPLNAKTIAWVHTYRNSPVCYLQLGHGPTAYSDKNFVTLLGNSIRWSTKEAATMKENKAVK
jgi:type 1 glutamine amidotransferase